MLSLVEAATRQGSELPFSWNIHGLFFSLSSTARQTHDVHSLTLPSRTVALFVIVSVSGLVLSACTTSTPPGVAHFGVTTTTSNGAITTTTNKYAAWLAYSRCMRSNGVPTYPDPKQLDGDVQVPGSPAGVNPDSPAFATAQQSCHHLEPNDGQSTNAERQRASSRMLQLSKCMRQQGITEFPDPTFDPPTNRGGFSDIVSNDGVWLAIPNAVDLHSPAFDKASAACGFGAS